MCEDFMNYSFRAQGMSLYNLPCCWCYRELLPNKGIFLPFIQLYTLNHRQTVMQFYIDSYS